MTVLISAAARSYFVKVNSGNISNDPVIITPVKIGWMPSATSCCYFFGGNRGFASHFLIEQFLYNSMIFFVHFKSIDHSIDFRCCHLIVRDKNGHPDILIRPHWNVSSTMVFSRGYYLLYGTRFYTLKYNHFFKTADIILSLWNDT